MDRFVGTNVAVQRMVMDLEGAFSLWLDSRRSGNTRRAYASAWAMLLGFCGKGIGEVERADVAGWVGAMRAQGRAASTIGQRVAAISSFFRYAGEELGLEVGNPALGRSLRPRVAKFSKSRFLDAGQARALLGAIERSSLQGRRDFALFLFFLLTGRRNSEVRNLRWSDFEEREGVVWYRWQGKGKVGRAELPGLCREALASLREICPDGQTPVFTALSRNGKRLDNLGEGWEPGERPISANQVGALLRKYLRKAGIEGEGVTVHSLRHTAAMLRKEAGADVEEVCAFLGHSSIAVTQVYLHRLEGQRDVRWEAVSNLLGL